jgi:hypothetical protein
MKIFKEGPGGIPSFKGGKDSPLGNWFRYLKRLIQIPVRGLKAALETALICQIISLWSNGFLAAVFLSLNSRAAFTK